MKNKFIRSFFISTIVLIIVIISALKVYALNEEKANFVSISSNNVNVGGTLDIKLDLTEISFEDYTVKIVSDINLDTPGVSSISKDNNISNENNNLIEKNSSSTNTIENTVDSFKNNIIDNTVNSNNIKENSKNTILENISEKTEVLKEDNNNSKEFTISNVKNLNALTISIKIPTDVKIGDIITLNIIITDNNNEKNILTSELKLNVVKNTATDELNNNINIEKTNNQSQLGNNLSTDKSTVNEVSKIEGSNVSVATTQANQSSVKSIGTSGSSSSAQTVTYNGSSDNYLNNIYINGETVSENYNKTNSTYFKIVSVDTNSIDISYDKSNSNSTVCVYGNTELKSGLNKILIAVTAQDKSVRNYRIYVNVK